MSQDELWKLNAFDLSSKLHAGEITALEATKASISRMKEKNPFLNAVVMDLSEQAMERAEVLDKKKSAGVKLGPLHGIPVTIKINIDQKGWPTTNGLAAQSALIATDNAPVVKNLEDAGAIVIGRTNTPEFSFRADTDNPLHGRTKNPWGPHVSPGGSSGGAGAAVMAGIGALAHGNDIGGSLRFPAAANGAVTVKPGLGRVPAWNSSQKTERGMLAQSMSVQGLLTRSALDLELAMPTMMKSDARDPFHVPLPYRMSRKNPKPKVAVCFETPGFETHPEVEKALDLAAATLKDAGYKLETAEPPFLKDTAISGYRALMGEVSELMGTDIKNNGSKEIQEIFHTYYELFPPYKGTELLQMMAKRSFYAREWSLFLEKFDLILSPFMPNPYFRPDRDKEGIEGVLEAIGSGIWSYSMNFVGLPAGCLPIILANLKDGKQPINVQIIGRRWREDAIVDAMIEIEKRIGTFCDELWKKIF